MTVLWGATRSGAAPFRPSWKGTFSSTPSYHLNTWFSPYIQMVYSCDTVRPA
jgi:hypothetical protein